MDPAGTGTPFTLGMAFSVKDSSSYFSSRAVKKGLSVVVRI